MIDTRFYDIKGPFSLKEIALQIGCDIEPDVADATIDGVSDLKDAGSSKISVFSNAKYRQQFLQTKAAACIVANNESSGSSNTLLLKSANPYYAYSQLINMFYAPRVSGSVLLEKNGSYISKSAKIGQNCSIGYGVVIEDDVEIGDNCFIDSGVVIKFGVKIGDCGRIGACSYISYSVIGNDFICLAGARIGCDGFGFATNGGVHNKIFHTGRVIIGDNVEIGANATIDRGSINDTIIGNMCRIDNLVQIGHNVKLGIGCVIVAQVGIAGSTKIGDYCVIGGQVGISGHLEIASLTQIAGGSGVIKDIPEQGSVVGGYPAVAIVDWHRQSVCLKKLIKK